MKLSEELQRQRKLVEDTLGPSIICSKCNATLATYASACTADLSDACPGFMRIEATRAAIAVSKEV